MSDAGVLARSTKTSFGAQWRALSVFTKVLVAILLACSAYVLLGQLVGGVVGSSNGASGTSSSLDDSAVGTAAYADLLARAGVSVSQLNAPLSSQPPSRATTLFLLDPTEWTLTQATSAASLVRAGMTVVASGAPATVDILRDLGAGRGVRWSAVTGDGGLFYTGTPFVPTTGPAPTLADGALDSPGPGTFVLARTARVDVLSGPPPLVVAVHDGGWFVALASASALQNANLAAADNAAFGVDLVTATGPHAVFDEYVHGAGRTGTGLAGLSAPWRYGLGLALLAALIGVLGAMRRFGPAQRAGRATLPPRVRYVEAMATHLETKGDEEVVDAAAPVTRALRATLATRLSQPLDASDADLAAAAARAPRHAHAYQRLVARASVAPVSAHDVVEVGRAFAQVTHSTFERVDGDD